MQTRFVVSVCAVVCGLAACNYDVPLSGRGSNDIEPSPTSSSSSSSGYSSHTSSSGYSSSSSSGYEPPEPPECTQDEECTTKHAGDVDAGADRCLVWTCDESWGKCRSRVNLDNAECQCASPSDCYAYNPSFGSKTCNKVTCDDHICHKVTLPAGPASSERAGDCAKHTCDGASEEQVRSVDMADLDDDKNPCTVDSCSETGPVHTNVTNGTTCGDGAICMEGKCLPCKPTNPTSCGGEGAGEPTNDSSSTPDSFKQWSPMCTFSSGTDVDWYTFFAEDGFWADVFDFTVWSTAPKVEVCLYVKCVSGTPEGGCSVKKQGPNGSVGCCWEGSPATLNPHWDMDCSGTTEDEGTTYMSVRTPGGGSCEQYAINGGY